MGYRLFSDVTADVSEELMAGMPTVEFVPMQVKVGDESYTYGPEGDLTVEYFYAEQRGGQVRQHVANQPDGLSGVL